MFFLDKHSSKSYLININSIIIDLHSEKEGNNAPDARLLSRVLLSREGCRAQLSQ